MYGDLKLWTLQRQWDGHRIQKTHSSTKPEVMEAAMTMKTSKAARVIMEFSEIVRYTMVWMLKAADTTRTLY